MAIAPPLCSFSSSLTPHPHTDGYKCQHPLPLRLTPPQGNVPPPPCVCYANPLPPAHIFCANQIGDGGERGKRVGRVEEGMGGGNRRRGGAHIDAHRHARWWHSLLSSASLLRQLSQTLSFILVPADMEES